MNTKQTLLLALVATIAIVNQSCNTGDDNEQVKNLELQQNILNDFAENTVVETYSQMSQKMAQLHQTCTDMQAQPTQEKLLRAREEWKTVRQYWEQSEAFLFGPVATENIDPGTDTWPIDLAGLKAIIGNDDELSESYISNLGDELKGYHPVEYLLWGENSNKTAEDFSERELQLLALLSNDLMQKATQLLSEWQTDGKNFSATFTSAGPNNSTYGTQLLVFEEMVNALAGICDEVAGGKIGEPFHAKDPALEESPFSKNSLTDFKNNIIGVKNAYLGKNYGLSDFMQNNNLSLDAKIKNEMENALKAFDAITLPFGEAITQQPTQVQNLAEQIDILKATLENELLPFIKKSIASK
ncbi:hypothetical protein GC194_06705 [bacterium]|nr:hypothetical protein [bacterium]